MVLAVKFSITNSTKGHSDGGGLIFPIQASDRHFRVSFQHSYVVRVLSRVSPILEMFASWPFFFFLFLSLLSIIVIHLLPIFFSLSASFSLVSLHSLAAA